MEYSIAITAASVGVVNPVIIPTIIITGVIRAKIPSLPFTNTFLIDNGIEDLYPLFTEITVDVVNRATPIKIPAPIPAKNKSATESPAVNPHKIISILGRKIIPIGEDAAVMAAEYLELYPCLTMAGIIIGPVAEVSATEGAETPAENLLEKMFGEEGPRG